MESSDDRLLDRENERIAREYTPAIVFVALVIMVGITVNIFATIFYCCKARKTAFHIFMFSLSLTDLITNVILTERFVELFYTFEYRTMIVCKLFYVLRHFLTGNSLLFMVAIAFDRYRRVCLPFSKQITIREACYILFVLILLSLVVSVRYFATVDIVRINITIESNATIAGHSCLFTGKDELALVEKVFNFVDIGTHGIITFLLALFYSLVIRKLIKTRKRMKSHINPEIVAYICKDSGDTRNDDTRNEDPETGYIEIPIDQKIDDGSTTLTSNRTTHLVAHSVPHLNCTKEIKHHERSHSLPTCTGEPVDTDSTQDQSTSRAHQQHINKSQNPILPAHSKSKKRRVTTSNFEEKMAVMASVITIASFVCIVPYYISTISYSPNLSGKGIPTEVDVLFSRSTYILNSAINPFIILVFDGPFRTYVVDTLLHFCPKSVNRNL